MVLAISTSVTQSTPILHSKDPQHSSGTAREKHFFLVPIKAGNASSPVFNILHVERASRAAKRPQ